MNTRVQRWGNSQGLRLSKEVLEHAHILIGDEVSVTVKHGRIILAPVRPARKKKSLKALVGRIPRGQVAQETDWGEPVGREEW